MSKEKPGLNFKNFSKEEKDFFLNQWLPQLEKQVKKAGSIEKFIKANEHLAPQLKEISLKSGNNIAKSAPETFPELGITQEELKEAYEKQLKILDSVITPPLSEEKLSEDDTHIMGEDKIDKSE